MSLLPPLADEPPFQWPDDVPPSLTRAIALFVLALMQDDYDLAQQKLQMSPKEAAQALKSLERFLGGPVLVPEGKRMRITPLGSVAYEPAFRWCMRVRYGRIVGCFAVVLADSTMWFRRMRDRLMSWFFGRSRESQDG